MNDGGCGEYLFVNSDLYRDFFANLAHNCLLCGFAGLNLAARKLPQACRDLVWATPKGQNPGYAVICGDISKHRTDHGK
jgi:hypothetical protein